MLTSLSLSSWGLPRWLLWSRRIIALKLYFCSRQHVFKGFVFFARGRQVLSVIDKRSRNILDSRVYLGYSILEVRGENKGIL